MDATTPPYSIDRYRDIVTELTQYLVDTLHYEMQNVVFIPVSGYRGENICNLSRDCGLQVNIIYKCL